MDQFYPKNSPMMPEWREYANAQVLNWWKVFSNNEFDVGCSKCAQHCIHLQEDTILRKVSVNPISRPNDLREQIVKLKRTGVILEY